MIDVAMGFTPGSTFANLSLSYSSSRSFAPPRPHPRPPTHLRLCFSSVRAPHRPVEPGAAARAPRELARLAPKAAEPHVLLASLAERGRRYDEALAHLKRAVEVAPDSAGPLMGSAPST
jgi:hypothetical protein